MIKAYEKFSNQSLSKDFFSSEFDCRCHYPECTMTYVDEELIQYLQGKRDFLKKGIILNSGFRCTRHNIDEGGKPGSQHLLGKAADIRVNGIDSKRLAQIFDDADGLGIYDTFIHVDKRGHRSRWSG